MTTAGISPTTANVLTDDCLFLETLIYIDDRYSNIVKFELNAAQRILYDNLSPRNLVVKAGQLGITTFFLARGFKKVITEDNRTAVVVAHEEFLTQRLLRRIRVMYDRLPFPDSRKPVMHHDSTYEKSFPKRNSTFYIGTAGAKVFGRGEPIHFFLGSEVAFWPDPNRIILPVEDRVPLEQGCEMTLESTPNGIGSSEHPNVFYQLVEDARQGDSIYTLSALPWWLEPEYKLPYGSSYALEADRGHISNYTQEELDLIHRVGWDDAEAEERIRWRRRKVFAKRREHGSFLQEYLEDIASCFLSVGLPFYEPDVLERLRSGCYPADEHITHAEIWFPPAHPEDNPVYVVSVDPGMGKVTRSVALVWRVDLDNYGRIRHEATLAGKYDPDTFAPMVMALARLYHTAKIVPEANGHGLSFCTGVKDYENLYYRTAVISEVVSKQIGWLTTGPARIGSNGTKMFMLTELLSILPIIETHDINLVSELLQVKYAGTSIKFLSSDDYHDAAAIMAATRHSYRTSGTVGYVGRTGWNW
mgnify:CR=1 FL=1